MMYSNCTFGSLKGIKYGQGFIGQARTFKTRLTGANAEGFMKHIHRDYHRLFSVFRTNKGHVFLALVCDPAHPVWNQLCNASEDLENKKLYTKASKKMAIAAKKNAEAQRILRMLPPAPRTPMWEDELPF